MSSVNLMAREVGAKIVFYGPGLSGKTTTLRKIHESVRPAHRGEMMSLATEGDRTLFFDFLPVKVEKVGDCTVRLALYTVPGQVFYNATRKLVLQGADGVVFVADSQPEAADNNRESLQNLEENLAEQGLRLDRFPLVIQYNKRDVPGVLPVAELRALLNPRGVPDIETCATSGRGILDGLKAITRLVIHDLREKRIVPSARTAPAASGRTPIPSPETPGFGPRAPTEGLAALGARLDGHDPGQLESPPPAPAGLARAADEAPPGSDAPGPFDAPGFRSTSQPRSPGRIGSGSHSPVPARPAMPPRPVAASAGSSARHTPVPPLPPPGAPSGTPVPPSAPSLRTPGTSPLAAPGALTGQRPLGPVSALAPHSLLDYALAAEAAFREGRHEACVLACREGVRRALAHAGAGSEREQAYLLRVDGADLLRLEGLETRQPLRMDDAAFALYVLMQTLTRLASAGLPD